jgi:hypothetical protein
MLLGVSSQRAGLTHMLFLGHIITLMIYKLRLGFMIIDAEACVQLRGKDIIRRKTPIGNRKIRRKNVGGSERYLQPLPGDLQEAAQ